MNENVTFFRGNVVVPAHQDARAKTFKAGKVISIRSDSAVGSAGPRRAGCSLAHKPGERAARVPLDDGAKRRSRRGRQSRQPFAASRLASPI